VVEVVDVEVVEVVDVVLVVEVVDVVDVVLVVLVVEVVVVVNGWIFSTTSFEKHPNVKLTNLMQVALSGNVIITVDPIEGKLTELPSIAIV
jgi:hypothetical protein